MGGGLMAAMIVLGAIGGQQFERAEYCQGVAAAIVAYESMAVAGMPRAGGSAASDEVQEPGERVEGLRDLGGVLSDARETLTEATATLAELRGLVESLRESGITIRPGAKGIEEPVVEPIVEPVQDDETGADVGATSGCPGGVCPVVEPRRVEVRTMPTQSRRLLPWR